MRLTAPLFKKKVISFLFRGKRRKVKAVELPALQHRFVDYQRQETNMLILRHPYLTVEQSKGHTKDVKQRPNPMDFWNVKRNEKFARRLTWAEQLSHLRVKDAWD